MNKKIFIVEGVWHVGKTTFINNIRKSADIIVFPEPSHLTAGISNSQDARDEWYAQAHLDNFRRAVKEGGSNAVFIDRSIITSIAFRNAYIKNQNIVVTDLYAAFKKELRDVISNGFIVYIVFIEMSNKEHTHAYLTEHTFLKRFAHDSCLELYQVYISRIINTLVAQGLVKRLDNPTFTDVLSILAHA